MIRAHRIARYAAAGLFVGTLASILVIGCTTQNRPATPPPAHNGSPATQASAGPQRGRAQIWAENCQRCHNMRAPDSYSDGEWEVAMTQMRIRGYLTGQEHKAIEEFLKSAN